MELSSYHLMHHLKKIVTFTRQQLRKADYPCVQHSTARHGVEWVYR